MPASRLLLAALALIAAAPCAAAQDARLSASAPRVLFAVSDSVKVGGARQRVVTTLTYNPAAGTYVHTMEGADGRVLSRSVQRISVAAPTETERAVAESLVAGHPEIAPLVVRAEGTVLVEGGFPLVREAGHPCGPGGRCVTYDVIDVTPDARRRLRYVVVDLRAVRVLDADADAALDSNLANPAARRQSRHQ